MVILICLVNPKGIASGNQDVDSFTEVRSQLSKSKKSKLLFVSSDGDFFDFTGTSSLRKTFAADFALEGISEVLSAASFGDLYFNKYLNSKGITHILVPWSTAQSNKIVRKWGVHGNIAINLKDPFFKKQTVTSGEHPVVMYEVAINQKSDFVPIEYIINWDQSTRVNFYRPVERLREVGFYDYKFESKFKDGPTLSWVMADDMGNPEHPAFEIQTPKSDNELFLLSIEFVAAYGSYAPSQVVTVSSDSWTKGVMVSAGKTGRATFEVRAGEAVTFGNGLPCRRADSFDPASSNGQRFCFGISKITVRPVQAN
jgi:hypothetical protein